MQCTSLPIYTESKPKQSPRCNVGVSPFSKSIKI